MKLRQLEMELQQVEGFSEPKLQYEQYSTTPHLAACMIHTADSQFGDIEGCSVADLGCGCGMLSIASVMLGAESVTGVEIDTDAISIFQENIEDIGLDESAIDIVQTDICNDVNCNTSPLREKSFDTVVMNPPFGTKQTKGADMMFLTAAVKLARNAVYSLHKSSTRDHILKKAGDFGMVATVVAELRYNLDASYKFHKKKSQDIAVDLIRFAFK